MCAATLLADDRQLKVPGQWIPLDLGRITSDSGAAVMLQSAEQTDDEAPAHKKRVVDVNCEGAQVQCAQRRLQVLPTVGGLHGGEDIQLPHVQQRHQNGVVELRGGHGGVAAHRQIEQLHPDVQQRGGLDEGEHAVQRRVAQRAHQRQRVHVRVGAHVRPSPSPMPQQKHVLLLLRVEVGIAVVTRALQRELQHVQ